MPFGQHGAVRIGEPDAKRSAVFELQCKRLPNELRWRLGAVQIERALDAMQSRNRHPRSLRHPLIAIDPVAHATEHFLVTHQIANPGIRLDQLEPRVFHAVIVGGVERSG